VGEADRGSQTPHATAGRRAGAEARPAPNATAGRCIEEPAPTPPRAPNPSESMIHVPGTILVWSSRRCVWIKVLGVAARRFGAPCGLGPAATRYGEGAGQRATAPEWQSRCLACHREQRRSLCRNSSGDARHRPRRFGYHSQARTTAHRKRAPLKRQGDRSTLGSCTRLRTFSCCT
jgi:hypothetical protein